jgi:predicted TIM-barrel fold metal-dependent hydrolase
VNPPDPPFVDAHHHLWDLERNPYPWLTIEPPPQMVSGDIRPLRHSYRLGDYLADAREQNVIRSVHIEAGWDPKQPVMETEWLQGLADEHGYPHGIVASARLDAPDVEDTIARHVEHPNVRGIRQILSWHEDPVLCQCDKSDYLTDPAWRLGFALLERYDLLYSDLIAAFRTITEDFSPDERALLFHENATSVYRLA